MLTPVLCYLQDGQEKHQQTQEAAHILSILDFHDISQPRYGTFWHALLGCHFKQRCQTRPLPPFSRILSMIRGRFALNSVQPSRLPSSLGSQEADRMP